MYYPICLDVRNQTCLVVGGGRVAAGKAIALAQAGAAVRVVAPRAARMLRETAGITVEMRPYAPGDEAGAALVFAATDDASVNALVAARCRAAGVWCCVADDPGAGDFVTPATVRRGDLTVSVSTGGASPALAKRLRRELEGEFPEAYAAYTAFLREMRERAAAEIADPARRRAAAAELASQAGFERFRALDGAERRRWGAMVIARRRTERDEEAR